jgi:L-threonylcarbamoyladenylate synthase
VTELVSIERDGPAAAVSALERTVQSGGVALFPADGLYGLACDPLNAVAIERIHAIKGRDDGKPSAIMYFSGLIMRELLGELGEHASAAVAALLPGPVTLVIANPSHRYPLACREDLDRLGIRLIDGPLKGASCPIFQTSANRSGTPAPASFAEIPPELLDETDLAIDGGALTGLPSTVIDITAIDAEGEFWVLREGGLPRADVERLLAPISSAAR